MRIKLILAMLLCAESAWANSWEIDQVMRVETDGEKPKDFLVKYLVTKQKLWRSVKPKDAKDDAQTVYSIFDSVRFFQCETVNKKGTCTVATVSTFDPILLWAHSYRMDLKIKKVNFKNTGKTTKILDRNVDCMTTIVGGQVGGSATNSYKVGRTTYSCFDKAIDMDSLAAHMVKKMKTIKSYVDGDNLVKYEKLTGLGLPLKEVSTFKSAGVGPFGVGKTKITIVTSAISDKRLDITRLKLPTGFEVVDMSDQLQDVSFTPGKK